MQNSTKQDVTGPTRSFSDPLLRYSWSNSKDLAKNLELDNEPSTGNLRGWASVFMLLIALTISSNCLGDSRWALETINWSEHHAGSATNETHNGFTLSYDGWGAGRFTNSYGNESTLFAKSWHVRPRLALTVGIASNYPGGYDGWRVAGFATYHQPLIKNFGLSLSTNLYVSFVGFRLNL